MQRLWFLMCCSAISLISLRKGTLCVPGTLLCTRFLSRRLDGAICESDLASLDTTRRALISIRDGHYNSQRAPPWLVTRFHIITRAVHGILPPQLVLL